MYNDDEALTTNEKNFLALIVLFTFFIGTVVGVGVEYAICKNQMKRDLVNRELITPRMVGSNSVDATVIFVWKDTGEPWKFAMPKK
jgi:hypothetical protein